MNQIMWVLLNSILIFGKGQYLLPDNYTLQSPIVIPEKDYPYRIVYAPDELSFTYQIVANIIIFRSLLGDRMVEKQIWLDDWSIRNFAYSADSDRLYIVSEKSK